MSVILLALTGTIYLCFFIHNRAWLTSAAYEAALAGGMEGCREGGKIEETANVRSRELGNTGFFGAENLQVQVSAGKQVQVVYNADLISGFAGFSWKLQAQGSAEIIRPVEWIRKIRALADIVGRGQ